MAYLRVTTPHIGTVLKDFLGQFPSLFVVVPTCAVVLMNLRVIGTNLEIEKQNFPKLTNSLKYFFSCH